MEVNKRLASVLPRELTVPELCLTVRGHQSPLPAFPAPGKAKGQRVTLIYQRKQWAKELIPVINISQILRSPLIMHPEELKKYLRTDQKKG